MNKSLWTGLLVGVMMCFLFSSTASASRIALTLGWHNLNSDDFWVLDAGGDINGKKIKGGKLDGSKLKNFKSNTIDLSYFQPTGDASWWQLKKINKKFTKFTNKRLTRAKESLGIESTTDLFAQYTAGDQNVKDTIDNLFNKKFKGKIGNQKFAAYIKPFPNPYNEAPVNPVPEPTTMVLFGLGLLGLAGVSRKKLK